jgi:His/Glu/Gln/Arg/opine family amino acid ABC transporter permease subunit
MSPDIFIKATPIVLQGLQLTLIITICSFLLGQILALPLGLARQANSPLLRWPAVIYTFLIRGSPLLVQLFIIYYGLGQIPAVRNSILWLILREPLYCGIIAISLNSAAYMAEVVAGALRRVPKGQTEACISLGISRRHRFTDVLLPQVYRELLPNIGNEIILVLKSSSLASAVTIMEITGVARAFTARTFAPFEVFITAGILYLAIGFAFTFLFRMLERRYGITGTRTPAPEASA